MTLHQGRIYQAGNISLRPPSLAEIDCAEDVRESAEWWLDQAGKSTQVYYFSVFDGHELVGQILLHDIDEASKEALIAYHLFQPEYRGKGIGTTMLTLLKKYIHAETDLKRVIIITSRDNIASQRIAEKCGFQYAGTPREDPIDGVLYEWRVRPE